MHSSNPTIKTEVRGEKKQNKKNMHACHQKMQGWGRLRARTEGGKRMGATSVPQNHWEEGKFRELPPESVLGRVK